MNKSDNNKRHLVAHFALLCFFVLGLLSYTGLVSAAELTKLPNIEAENYLLVDFHSKKVLVSKNADKSIEPASITKLMSAYVIYQELKKGNIEPSDFVLISEKAWRMEGSRMFVEARKKVPFERLLFGLIIQSGNDAAIALAEHVAGTETGFVEKMNTEATRLGLKNTFFVNATGWPDKGHFTTANDIATLTIAVINEFPEHYKLYKQKEYSYNGIKQYNRNKLLWLDPSVDGVKTGHTDSAGYCLVASAKRNGMRLISVVLGANSNKERSDASQQLLEYGYRNFETRKLYKGGGVLENVRIWKGSKNNVPIGFIDDFYITVAKGSYARLKGSMQYESGVEAPVSRGDAVGKVVIKDGESVVIEVPLVALNNVSSGSLWRRMTDGVQKVFH